MRTKQSGFTIIELIVVIALLGILSAVALPRFINVTDQAHDAAVEGAGAGFATGVALLKAQVVANGDLGSAADDIQGYGEDEVLDVNINGYAVATNDVNGLTPAAGSDCADVWNALFQSNGPAASDAAPADSGIDYLASVTSGICLYRYQQDLGTTRDINYTASTGNVSVTIP
ncbi:MAG: type II secretion system protein [Motiliproteus sp.]